MKKSVEIVIDALFTITDLDAYEKHNLNPKNELKDITFFRRPIYEGDIINLSQGEDGFTVITIDEDGEKKNVRILETIEEIQTVMAKMEILKSDEEIFNYLNEKYKNLSKKNQKKIGLFKK
jgi:hypothetical protein